MDTNPIQLLDKNITPFNVKGVTALHGDIRKSFIEITDKVPGCCYNANSNMFTFDGDIVVSPGTVFIYQAIYNQPDRCCKKYTLRWKERTMALIEISVYRWSSNASHEINTTNIMLRKIIEALHSWKKTPNPHHEWEELHTLPHDLFLMILSYI